MSNFDILNPQYLERLIDPFLPGAAGYITPIKYQAITPDIFALLFRATGKDEQDRFFVSLEFDYVKDMAAAKEIIRKWSGGAVQQVLWPAGKADEADDELGVRVVTAEPYYAVLTIIEKPQDLGYWSEHMVLRPGDNLKATLVSLSDKQIGFVQKFVGEHSKPQTQAPDSNTTDLTLAIYKNADGGLEFFGD